MGERGRKGDPQRAERNEKRTERGKKKKKKKKITLRRCATGPTLKLMRSQYHRAKCFIHTCIILSLCRLILLL